ncbi:MAG: hypothetical protein ABIF10_06755 [Candidatus Woesearchaeota archaeon]
MLSRREFTALCLSIPGIMLTGAVQAEPSFLVKPHYSLERLCARKFKIVKRFEQVDPISKESKIRTQYYAAAPKDLDFSLLKDYCVLASEYLDDCINGLPSFEWIVPDRDYDKDYRFKGFIGHSAIFSIEYLRPNTKPDKPQYYQVEQKPLVFEVSSLCAFVGLGPRALTDPFEAVLLVATASDKSRYNDVFVKSRKTFVNALKYHSATKLAMKNDRSDCREIVRRAYRKEIDYDEYLMRAMLFVHDYGPQQVYSLFKNSPIGFLDAISARKQKI